jgi:hypothetical protein
MRRVNARWYGIAALALALSLAGCKGDRKSGESSAQAAARKLKEQLALPKDNQYLGATVLLQDDRLIFKYGTNLTIDELKKFLADQTQGKEILMNTDLGLGVRGQNGEIINYAWFKRDPDIYKFKTALDVAVSPLPKEIKKDQKIE